VRFVAVWISGELYPDESARISVFDHGLVTGDGVFETIKVSQGVPFALSRHLARLRRSATGLGLPEPDLDEIRSGVVAVIRESAPLPLARLRITLTAGVAPLSSQRGVPGGSARADAQRRVPGGPTVIVAMAPQRPAAETADVVVVPWRRNEHGALTGLKTTSYAENVRALAYAAERDAGEAIFANTAGSLCEGTGSNVFLVTRGKLLTPPLSAGCLAGVTRGLVLEWAGAEEADLPVGELAQADEAFLTGTTRDVQPIRKVNDVILAAAPGPVTRKAAEAFALRAAESADP
jgi:branched-chain amino acid aminotransferase